jgi:AraC-like DNA-binding protein
MGYKRIIHKDATKQESIWLCTSHLHELLVPDPNHSPQYIDVSHLSRIFSQPLTVLFAGYSRWFAGQKMKRQGQPGVLGIEYVRSGNLVLIKDNRESLIQPGNVYFLREDFPNADRTGPAGMLLKRYLWLTGAVLENLLHSLNLWGRDGLRLQHPRKFEALMKQMTTLLDANPPDVDLRASTLAYQILLFLGQSIHPSLPAIVEEALAFMQQNLHRQLQVKDLCEYLEVNEIRLRRLFVRHIQIPPITYFLKQKLTWSANMLCTTSFSIKEIAYEVGYDDPFYFSNQFKKHFGMSPKQYRESNYPVFRML